jgi:hypothetical protein
MIPSFSGYTTDNNGVDVVEAAGIEPVPGQQIILLMAHDLRHN